MSQSETPKFDNRGFKFSKIDEAWVYANAANNEYDFIKALQKSSEDENPAEIEHRYLALLGERALNNALVDIDPDKRNEEYYRVGRTIKGGPINIEAERERAKKRFEHLADQAIAVMTGNGDPASSPFALGNSNPKSRNPLGRISYKPAEDGFLHGKKSIGNSQTTHKPANNVDIVLEAGSKITDDFLER